MPIAPTAIVYLPDAESHRGSGLKVAGLTVLERLLLTAARAGVREIYLPTRLTHALPAERLKQFGHVGGSVRCLSDLAHDEAARVSQSSVLLLPAHTVLDPGSLERLGRAHPRVQVVLQDYAARRVSDPKAMARRRGV